MKFVADLHIHTVASGHAYSTILENARAAADIGLAMIAITDHGPDMPGGPHAYHFGNLKAVPEELFGVRILKGVEANVIDRDGTLDLAEERLAGLDIVLAGLHSVCSPYGSVLENTQMMVNAMKNPWVDAIVHPGNPEFLVDAEAIVKAAVEYDVALEINNSSLKISRVGSKPHCENIACLAKEYGAKIIVGTDSHFSLAIGDFSKANELLERVEISPDAVINTSIEGVLRHLNRRSNRKQSVR
ncbi:phosphatase [Pelosinus sp. IPA-1]|uniref:phosphatase n=1 Tax=Pelosinus sp. IPA-1 TaxID=3029569 RepID=UPI00243629B1|nr:phosphatase [Pelosinus sp. IPA-1]GMB01752.1 phosphatase [Pelosinus sp. IPA-1]